MKINKKILGLLVLLTSSIFVHGSDADEKLTRLRQKYADTEKLINEMTPYIKGNKGFFDFYSDYPKARTIVSDYQMSIESVHSCRQWSLKESRVLSDHAIASKNVCRAYVEHFEGKNKFPVHIQEKLDLYLSEDATK